MNSTKLIRALKTLTSDEWSSFRKFLLSHTRKGSDNFNLFEFLQLRKDRLDNLTNADTVREKYFAAMTSKGFSNMMSRLFNWLEEWLSIDQMKKQRYENELLLLKSYNDRGLYTLADQTFSRLEKKIKSSKRWDIENNKALTRLYHYQHYSDNPIKYSSDSKPIEDLASCYAWQFKEQSLLYYLELNNWARIKNKDLSQPLESLQKSISNISDSNLSKYIGLLHEMIINDNVKCLYLLKDSLVKEKITEDSELHTLVVLYSISSMTRFWQLKILNDHQLASDLYEYALTKGILMKSGKIPHVRFQNILGALCVLKPFEWNAQFIERWVDKVNVKNIESTKSLSLAHNCFIHERYDSIIPLLRGIEFEKYDQKVSSMTLEMIGLYKSGNEYNDILASTISNFKRSLHRNKKNLSNKFYWSYRNLIDFIENLSNRDYSKNEINLETYENLIYRTWCEKQLT